MSPVVSTVILIAVTIAVSLGVGMWLQDITTGYMRGSTDEMSLDSATAITTTITAWVRNSGKDTIYLDKAEAYVNGAPVDITVEVDSTPVGDVSLPVDDVAKVTITLPLASPLVPGTTYEVKFVSNEGTQLVFSVEAK